MGLAAALLPKGLFDAYGVDSIDPKEVNLTPSALFHLPGGGSDLVLLRASGILIIRRRPIPYCKTGGKGSGVATGKVNGWK